MNLNFEINWRVAALALLVLVGGSYFTVPKGDFIWDDKGLIFNDWSVQTGGLTKFFKPSYWSGIAPEDRGRFRPLRAVFFALDYKLYGESPAGYHVTNLLLHLACSLMVFAVARRLGLEGPAALAAAALFAVHPAHTESVTWVKNRSDLIATFFILASFYFFVGGRLALSVLLFVPSLLAKEIGLSYPLVLALYMASREKLSSLREYASRLLPYALLAALFFALTALFWRKDPGAAFTPDAQDHFQTVLVSIGFYARLLFVPYPLKAEHEFEPPFTWSDPYLLSGALVCAGLAFLWLKRRDKDYAFYSLAAFAALLPVINVYFLSSRLIAEQRIYLASVFFCLLAGAGFKALSARAGLRAALAPAAALVLLFAGLTYARNGTWHDEMSFWKEAVRQTPGHYRSNFNLGLAYQLAGDYESAYGYMKKASEGWDAPNVFYSLGYVSARLGRGDESIAAYERCLMHGGDKNPDAFNNLAIEYDKKGIIKRAEANFLNAIAVAPDYAPAYFNLAELYRKSGKPALAEKYARLGGGLKK